MSLTPILEVAISLSLLYLFFSQVVLSGFELIASKINLRGRFLRYQLNKALSSGNDKNWAELMYRHPSVDMLAQTTKRPPTYVPSSVFVKAIVDLVIDEARTHKFVQQPTGEYKYQVTDPGAGQATALAKFEAGLAKVSSGDFKRLLQSLLLNAQGCTVTGAGAEGDEKIFAEFVRGLAIWYDNYMERVTGWYKREIRPYLFALGLLLAIACNLDSLYVVRYFWEHAEERQRVADYAAEVVQRGKVAAPSPTSTKPTDSLAIARQVRAFINQADSLTKGLQRHGYPIGWTIPPTVDSTKLPDSFFMYQPAVVRAPTWSQRMWRRIRGERAAGTVLRPAYWVHHQRSLTPAPAADSRQSVVPATMVQWQRDTLLQLPARGGLVLRSAPPAMTAPNLQQPWWLIGLGWLLTGAALSFGAPFWFELLNRLVNMRNQGLRPPTATATSPKEPS